jgi:molybdenum cofactor cytidylyltransferase
VPPAVSAIILAAGESTRMGTQKALLPWEGAPTLIAYELAQLASIEDVREIIVVTGHQPQRITEIVSRSRKARAVQNDAYTTGKVSSIRAGVAAVSDEAASIMLCAVDQPRSSSILSTLLNEHFARKATITLPAHHGHRGHPVIFDALLRDELLAIREETQGIRAVLERHAGAVNAVELDDPAILLDLNTPGDLPTTRTP